MEHKLLYTLTVFQLLICSFSQRPSEAVEEPPMIAAYFYKFNKDFLNFEKVDSNETQKHFFNDTVLLLECNATYPIEWKSLQSKYKSFEETRRHAKHFEDLNGYLYTAKLALQLNMPYQQEDDKTNSTFTCKATQKDGRVFQSHVYMAAYDNGSPTFTLELTSKLTKEDINSMPEITDGGHIPVVPLELNSDRFCWNCGFFDEMDRNLPYFLRKCSNKQLNSKCYRSNGTTIKVHGYFGEINLTSKECKSISLGSRFVPKLEFCFENGSFPEVEPNPLDFLRQKLLLDIARRRLRISQQQILANEEILSRIGRDTGHSLSGVPQLYFQWTHVRSEEMLFIYPFEKKEVYAGEDVGVTCEYSRFYFSLGSWFAIKHPNGTVEYIKGLDRKPCQSLEFFPWKNEQDFKSDKLVGCEWSTQLKDRLSFTSTIRRRLEDVGCYEVFCIGPVWNSTEWVNISLPITVAALPSEKPPKVRMRSNEWDKNDIQEEDQFLEKATAPNSNAVFQLDCKAEYPIEWIFQYSQGQANDGTMPKVIQAETRRDVIDFEDGKTYSYSAKVILLYPEKATDLSHFMCASTKIKTRKLETHVHVAKVENATALQLKVSKAHLEIISKPEPYSTFKENCPTKLSYSLNEDNAKVDGRQSCWSCGAIAGVIQILDCRTPIQCNSLSTRSDKTSNCLVGVDWSTCDSGYLRGNSPDRCSTFTEEGKRAGGRYSVPGCPYYEEEGRFGSMPKFSQCVNENNDVVASGLLYFGIRREEDHENEKRAPEQQKAYANWGSADISDMLYMHPLKSYVNPGEPVEIKCEYSRLYFSLGSWFGVKHPSGFIQHFRAVDIRPCDSDTERQQSTAKNGTESALLCDPSEEASRRGTFIATIRKAFVATGRYDIFCFGPMWNTPKWVNTSRSFDAVKWEEPKVISVTSDGNEKFIIGERNRSLRCEFEGNPVPTVRWSTPGKIQLNSVTRCLTSTLIIEQVNFSSGGKYTCHAESFNSSHFQEYTINPEFPPKAEPILSPFAITAIVVGCIVALFCLIAAFAKMWETIREQRKALRFLTEEEVKEFKEGIPGGNSLNANEYIDNVGAVDALPYDAKYEIPLNRLRINYAAILGSGEYGVILKAKLRPRKTPNYDNLTMQYKVGENVAVMETGNHEMDAILHELEVAVKMCKKNLGVEAFKALLSEVKVMAYLGQHENIVSLIGATTGNIRNREIYITEELCQNGSLDNFVRKHKKIFFNKVKRGRYLNELEPTTKTVVPSATTDGNIEQLHPDSQIMFSTTELIRWSLNVASGLDFIHTKRVIHGDLALRNVLITENFVAKICDFGLSRRLGEISIYAKTTECPLPWRSMAIESLQHLHFSVKSDMWSLGVTLWELFTLGSIPYQGMSYNSEFIKEIENGSLRLPKPHCTPNQIYDFMAMCWESMPEDRPSTVDLQAICEGLLQTSPTE